MERRCICTSVALVRVSRSLPCWGRRFHILLAVMLGQIPCPLEDEAGIKRYCGSVDSPVLILHPSLVMIARGSCKKTKNAAPRLPNNRSLHLTIPQPTPTYIPSTNLRHHLKSADRKHNPHIYIR